MTGEHPRTRLLTVIHSPTRLAILGTLRHVEQINFTDLQQALDLSTTELSRQLAILEKESLIEIGKFRERRHPVTRIWLSESGRQRFDDYLNQLRQVVQANL
ncbi:transcriptional regulator [Streptomyces chrestomyceticus]|uniref:Transcriptional regulator n=1 Tax=Streptomyces chrestomyceticus TaxID=68185 RepID=A0ABU7X1L8_9ACTN